MREISKEEFKKSIIENVKNQYRRTIDEATPQQIFQAVSFSARFLGARLSWKSFSPGRALAT